MKSFQFIGALGLLAVMAGCASRPTFPFFAKRDQVDTESEDLIELAKANTDTPILAPEGVRQEYDVTAIPTKGDASTTKLVSAMSAPSITQPTLITLPKGSDLDAQIRAAAGPVVLDFYADWCGPCRTQGKILHEMEGFAAANNTQIIKVNVDEHPEIAKKLKVASLPTLIVMKDGKVSQRVSGLTQREKLEQWMQP